MNEMATEHIRENGTEPNRIFGTTTPRLVASAAIFGLLFSYLFTQQTVGLNFLIFVLAIYVFAWLNRTLFIRKTLKQEPAIYLFSIATVFLAATLFFARTTIDGLTVMVILFIGLAQYLVLSDNARHPWYKPMFLIDMFFGALNRVLFGMGYFFTGAVDAIFKKRTAHHRGVFVGIIIGVALLIITVPFLLTADQQIADTFAELFENIDFGTIILFLFLFVLGSAMITGPVATADYGEFAGRGEKRDRADVRPIQPATTAIALTMVGIVYVLFAVVQFQYFFAPRATLNAVLGLTSAAYAVQGFGELIYITCLNIVLMAVAMRFTRQNGGKTQPYLKMLYTVLIIFNFIIMASSHLRMQLYEASFGYTVARLISHAFMILLVLLNVLMLVRIYSPRFKPGKWFVVAAVIFYCIITAINPDLYVVRRNIDRYEQEGKIDTPYMFSLSSSAVAEACDFVTAHPETFDDTAREYAEWNIDYYDAIHGNGWQSFNMADMTAYLRLEQLVK